MSSLIHHTEIILYVADQQLSTTFYSNLLRKKPELNVPGMTEFILSETCKLGLMPNDGIAKIITPETKHPSTGTGIPRCELYFSVDNPDEMHAYAIEQKITVVSPPEDRDWGHRVVYLQDPDGHIIAFAKQITHTR